MSLNRTIQVWRGLPSAQQRSLRLEQTVRKVARSMGFEGEPVPRNWIEAQQRSPQAQRDTSKPHSED